jgi:hypothetical protein
MQAQIIEIKVKMETQSTQIEAQIVDIKAQ